MITSRSAALDRKTRLEVLHDPNRGRAVSAFLDAGMSHRDIGEALNCSQRVLDILLLALVPRTPRMMSAAPDWDPRHTPRHFRGLMLYRPPRTPEGIAREQEKLAGHLGCEILRWLQSSTLTTADRLEIIQAAAFRLDQAPVNARGQYAFSADRAIEEVLGLWRPNGAIDPNENARLGRWLASWVRFWISDPEVWSLALDRVAAILGQEVQPQAA